MTRVIIIHGWEGKPDSNWFPWLVRELAARGIAVDSPQFPPDNTPSLNEWLDTLTEAAEGESDLCLVGHSLGVITILRYLESRAKRPIVGAVLVSGFARLVAIPQLSDFFRTPVNFDAVRTRCPQFRIIQGDNDPYVPMAEGEFLAMQLRSPLVVAHDKGHLSENGGGVTEYHPILDAILSVVEP